MWNELVGRRSAPKVHWVERGAVKNFADTIGDDNPVFRDEAAARAAGFDGIPAPPTFPVTFGFGTVEGLDLPEAGLIHGEQRFAYRRPLLAGERITCVTELMDVKEKRAQSGLLTFLVLEQTGKDAEGQPVFTSAATIIVTETVRKGLTG